MRDYDCFMNSSREPPIPSFFDLFIPLPFLEETDLFLEDTISFVDGEEMNK